MSAAKFRVVGPDLLGDYLKCGAVRDALDEIAGLGQGELAVDPPEQEPATDASTIRRDIRHRGATVGSVTVDGNAASASTERTAGAIAALLEHMVDREFAVADLAGALMTGYEELNLLYTLLPNISTRVDTREIGRVLVAETARMLSCRRVSLLVLDEDSKTYRVLASQGLPAEARDASISVAESVVGEALFGDDVLIVNDVAERPDLTDRSRGQYETNAFAVVRVPLCAQGEALGFITATEREGGAEFTARDRKLLEGLSAMGASALLNCRLHATVNKQMMSTIHALASAVDAKDHYTHDHAGRVSQLCVSIAHEMGIPDGVSYRDIELAGLLHDIGKIGIPDAILTKPDRLTPAEFKTIQTHVDIGADIVRHVPGLERVAEAIRHHHERFDGLGYPRGLVGDIIPLASRLIAAADTYDSLTSDRPYRQAGPPEAAIRELERCKQTQFDPNVVAAMTVVVERDLRRSDGSADAASG